MRDFLRRNRAFIRGFSAGFLGVMFGLLCIFAIDAEMCRQERESLQPQQCIFKINCRNI